MTFMHGERALAIGSQIITSTNDKSDVVLRCGYSLEASFFQGDR